MTSFVRGLRLFWGDMREFPVWLPLAATILAFLLIVVVVSGVHA
jgi:hypothetical protein